MAFGFNISRPHVAIGLNPNTPHGSFVSKVKKHPLTRFCWRPRQPEMKLLALPTPNGLSQRPDLVAEAARLVKKMNVDGGCGLDVLPAKTSRAPPLREIRSDEFDIPRRERIGKRKTSPLKVAEQPLEERDRLCDESVVFFTNVTSRSPPCKGAANPDHRR